MKHDPLNTGDCCCTCKNQIELFCHPWNKKYGKGTLNDNCGYACLVMFNKNNFKRAGIFFDTPHGLCELYIKI